MMHLDAEHSPTSSTSSQQDDTSGSGIKVKRKRNRERIADLCPMDVVLPPCTICGEKSTGLHYGVNSCEACKSFYRRTLRKKTLNYTCKCSPEEKDNWKRGPYKNGCPACRYERCLDVGMSKEAKKMGRYSLEHRTHNILQVKALEAGSSVDTPSSLSNLIDSALRKEMSNLNSNDSPTPFSSRVYSDQSRVPSWSPSGDVMSIEDIEEMIRTVTEAHNKYSEQIDDPAEMEKLHDEYLERYNLKTTIFGKMKAVPWKEFEEIYNNTGIDIDERLVHIVPATRYFGSQITEYVKFSREIPGFKNLSQTDQANLIKASRVENAVLGSYRMSHHCYDPVKQVVYMPWGARFHVDEFSKVLPFDIVVQRHKFSQRLMALDLSVEEDAVLRALVIVSPDRCELGDRDRVTVLYDKLTCCMWHLFTKRSNSTIVYKVFSLLTDLRNLSESEIEKAKQYLFELPEVAKKQDQDDFFSLLNDFFG